MVKSCHAPEIQLPLSTLSTSWRVFHAEQLLKNYEALQDGNRGFISWPGYWIGKFTREDLTLLMELVVFVKATKNQFPQEETLIENECTIPPGCVNLDGRQGKFVNELWHAR